MHVHKVIFIHVHTHLNIHVYKCSHAGKHTCSLSLSCSLSLTHTHKLTLTHTLVDARMHIQQKHGAVKMLFYYQNEDTGEYVRDLFAFQQDPDYNSVGNVMSLKCKKDDIYVNPSMIVRACVCVCVRSRVRVYVRVLICMSFPPLQLEMCSHVPLLKRRDSFQVSIRRQSVCPSVAYMRLRRVRVIRRIQLARFNLTWSFVAFSIHDSAHPVPQH